MCEQSNHHDVLVWIEPILIVEGFSLGVWITVKAFMLLTWFYWLNNVK